MDRKSLIHDMVSLGFGAEAINKKLTSEHLELLTAQEKKSLGLGFPEDLTPEDILKASGKKIESAADKAEVSPGSGVESIEPSGEIDKGKTIGTNPVTGTELTELNAHVVGICTAISNLLKAADPKTWEKYKKMKVDDPSIESKRKAYQFAFTRLLEIGYMPTQEGG